MGENEVVPFTLEGPTPTHCSLEGGGSGKKIGSSILDLHFSVGSQLGELSFTNFYSAFISVYVKRCAGIGGGKGAVQRHASIDESSLKEKSGSVQNKDGNGVEEVSGRFRRVPSASGGGRGKSVLLDLADRPWEYSTSKRLMICPHFELGSQDPFSIHATESLVEWRDVFVMRLIIHQPSSVWKRFSIENIKILRHLPRRAFNLDDGVRKDSRLVTLTTNTLRMLSGMTVEPEQEKPDK